MSANSAMTDASGLAKITVSSTTVSTFNIHGTTSYDATGKSRTVAFSANSATASIGTLKAEPDKGVTADGKTTSKITATVKGINGNLVSSGVDVTFGVDTNVTLSISTAKTDGSGQVTDTATSIKSGDYIVNATTASDQTGKALRSSLFRKAAR